LPTLKSSRVYPIILRFKTTVPLLLIYDQIHPTEMRLWPPGIRTSQDGQRSGYCNSYRDDQSEYVPQTLSHVSSPPI